MTPKRSGAPSVRTFRAQDVKTALAAVKSAMGADAVIVSTRTLPGGPLGTGEIEVTAALATEAELSAMRASAPRVRPVASVSSVSRPVAEPSPAPSIGPALADELGALRTAVESVREEIRVASRQATAERELLLPPHAAELYNQLKERGVAETVAEDLVREALGAQQLTTSGGLASAVRELLLDRVVPGRAPWLPDGQRVIALVGPTGVGKTTTVAKIAARALMESQLKVALVTVDTFRIGASEQLARYGSIMRLPTFVARSRADLASVVQKTRDHDLVLIDTAGRSLSEAVAKQAELIRSVPRVRLYLTLSAATGARELSGVAERYRTLEPERLILTKVDEAVSPGAVLSATRVIGRPICAVADGQGVPEDVHVWSATDWANFILGEQHAATKRSLSGR